MQIHSFLAGMANVHLVHNGRGVVIVDAGWQGCAGRILKQVARIGYQPREVRLILITHVHVDHAGSAAELRRLTDAPIAIHRGDEPIARAGKHSMPIGRGCAGVSSKWMVDRSFRELKFESFRPDLLLSDGQRLHDFGIEGRIVHTPGHTLGSVTLLLEDRTAFTGDALINLFRVGYPMYWESPDLARESGKKIQALKPRVLHCGHGRAFGGADLDRYLENYAAKKGR